MHISPRDVALGVLVVMVWGLHATVIKFGVREVPPLALLSLRLFFTALLFLPFAKRDEMLPAWLQLVKVGLLLNVLTFGCVFSSLQYLNAGTFSVLMEAQALLSIPVAYFFFKEKVDLKIIFGIIVGIAGLVIVLGAPQVANNTQGVVLALAAAVAWVAATTAMKTLPKMSPASYTVATAVPAVPFSMLGSWWLEQGQEAALRQADYKTLACVLAYQVVVMGLAMALWQRLLSRNAFSKINPLRILMPVFGILGGMLFLGEKLTWQFALGTVVAMAGIACVVLEKAALKNKTAP